jgi:hypothetical protein
LLDIGFLIHLVSASNTGNQLVSAILSLKEKVVPLSVVKKLVEGSYEQLTSRIDVALEEQRSLFVGDSNVEIARLATFTDRVVVGTAAGEYFEAKLESVNGEVVLSDPSSLDVPVVDSTNAAKAVRDYTLSAVDAILSEDADVATGHILELVSLHEQKQVEAARDFAAEIKAGLAGKRAWREVYGEQQEEIHRQVVDHLEAINKNQLEAKYTPLYETDDIPEETFELYREGVMADLSVVASRLESTHTQAETAYLPFVESLSDTEIGESEKEVLEKFCLFAEDLINDLRGLRGVISDAVQNEECVMCLGQIYDSVVEALTNYEIAGRFVERMVGAMDEAE